MENSPVPPQAPAPAPQKKKGIPALGWVGIGCGTVLVVVIIGISLLVGWLKRKWSDFAANPQKVGAEMLVDYHPDLDLVSSDDAAGEMTIHHNKTGETVTLSYKDIADGKITVTGSDGTVTQLGAGSVDQAPAWVPRVPNAQTAISVFHSESGDEISGSLSFTTGSSGEEVEEFLKEAAEKAGLSSSNSSSVSVNGNEQRTLEFEGGSKSLNATIVGAPGESLMVQIFYSDKK